VYMIMSDIWARSRGNSLSALVFFDISFHLARIP